MANYGGYARSNYFRVRNASAFLSWVETLPGVVARKEDGPERFVLLVEDGDDGG